MKKKTTIIISCILTGLLVAAVSVCATLFLVAQQEEEVAQITLTFQDADESVKTMTIPVGEVVPLPEAMHYEGYSFLGWKDASGTLHSGEQLSSSVDQSYSPVYIVALDTESHKPYLFPDANGFFHLHAPLTRGEAVQMLYTLLAVPVESQGNFFDVEPGAAYAKAAAAMYHLKVVPGSRLHPQETITRSELIAMLTAFYPQSEERIEFVDLEESDPVYPAFCTAVSREWISASEKAEPNRLLSKLDAIKLINRALGRVGLQDIPAKLRGFAPDLSHTDPDYAQLLEAALSHEHTWDGSQERWSSHEKVRPMPAGVLLLDSGLYCIGEDGLLMRDGQYGNFRFDEQGRYTSGMPELDEAVNACLSLLLVNEDSPQLEKLRILYDHVSKHFTYQRDRGHVSSDTSWANEEAYKFLTEGKGNCYAYAAAFASLAKAIGYDAVVCPGNIGIQNSPHCWVTIEIDGQSYIFDPEMEMAELMYRGKKTNMFMMDEEASGRWCYSPYY